MRSRSGQQAEAPGGRGGEQPPPLLVVEDDPGLQSQLRWGLDEFEVVVAGDREQALAELRRHEPPVVTLDLGLPPDPNGASEGLRALGEILEAAPGTKVIVVSGNDDRANAVRAVGLGAYDFYQKPIELEVLKLIIQRAYHVHRLEEENRRLQEASAQSPFEGLVASSPQMLQVCRMVEKVAPTEATVLLLGESGTGKEVIARALHALSPRARGPFVALNCAAIPDTLLEAELFGYEKGAFTGAARQTKGKIEYADGGTLFLDEIGDLPQPLQVKLLRFLQERVIERLGGRSEIAVDVRVVCATHQDLEALQREGRFREDLYYRINEIAIRIPPLREREGDAAVLAQAFLQRFAGGARRRLRGFSPEALAAIEAYDWPGNVRELENKVKRASIMAEGPLVTAADLELPEAGPGRMPELNLRVVREKAERAALERALRLHQGNVSQAAEVLGVSRPTLYDLMRKHGLKH
ncbi:MAG: PEP-CTERM-box response regulator transcription factor [Gammaproteobacteria bacterium]|nr:MAG: PEP-CTERM-box response regulator transcription factor [Gammaproteobacteria bacterium]